ncbi:MAG TPA: gamma-glutamyltransferase [Candidatus Marinimicrobia bacterium]|jgi:gamma-glutamyltranspeptidase/glutathione hydrolase|nr:gamma-glutamyltransferase [Candidatus Neomarinimicrobiota bacterium]MDP7565993.1 gamma-glutamyltransferase [Candidatus Neomarinimicrobiota bacterium]HJM70633.1 gamma-glutamyltransferase [Candidatus Neomarinimicrobiota bacterium]|tara:strand:- start:618 stop:2144 length:1527 start_codon:yes stop_codon:yes gene_type:complete
MQYGAIAGGEKTTVQSARDILENGGNAFDAAVGAVFTSMVSECNLTGPGGGGALLACPANSDPVLFDFFVDTPPPQPKKELDFFSVWVDFGPDQQEFHIGQSSAAVPGNTAGLLKVHERLGQIPLKAVLEPAMNIAREGAILNGTQGYLFKILEPIMTHSNNGKKLFAPKGTILKKGDRFQNPAFADLLEELVKQGADFFYKGDGAKLILDTLAPYGLLTPESLANYTVVERVPLKSEFNGKTVYTNPTPSVGGTLITFTLQLLEKAQTALSTNLMDLVRAMQITTAARRAASIDANDNHQILNILEENNFKHHFEQYRSQKPIYTADNNPPSHGSTTQVSIIDKAGNAASVTTTNGEGCGYLIPGLGVMLNNMLGEEDLNPSGFHHFIRQQRLPTMMSPTVVMGNEGPELVIGSGGSNRIRSAIIQVILNLMKGMDLERAITSSRVHLEGSILHCEPDIVLPDKHELPEGMLIHQWDIQNLFFGGVNAVTKNEAVGDLRRGGAGMIG